MMRSWGPTLWEWLLPIPIADIPISHSIMDRDTITLSGKQYNIYIYIHKQHPFINQTMNNIHEPWKTLQISSARAGWSRLYTCPTHTHIYIYIYLPRIYTYANTVNNMYIYIYTLYIYIYYALYVCMYVRSHHVWKCYLLKPHLCRLQPRYQESAKPGKPNLEPLSNSVIEH